MRYVIITSIKINMDRNALDNIMSRTSYRNFDPNVKVTDEELSTLLHAAMAAPTGVNRQPWHFVAVTSRRVLDELADALPYCKMAHSAPLAIVVCGDKSKFLEGDDATLWVQDVSAASENLLLVAHALGLGAVWTCAYPHEDRMASVSRILGLSDEFVPFNVIPVGRPLKLHAPVKKWHPEKVTYIA